ncbi:MAG: hypothetical protein KGL78_16275, partial [Burkholderiales bacterium]|nr:hypothetical protein [Burkholderiales bacterium]
MTSRPRRSASRSAATARQFGVAAWLLVCALTCSPVRAAPDSAKGDAVLQLLKERGLLPQADAAGASPLVRQVRDA